MARQLFDVIVPTFNNLDELKECLAGFSSQTCGGFRVLVCVDGSTDGTNEFLGTAHFPFACAVLRHEDGGNHGRNATRNLALPRLDSEFLLMLDSDSVPDSRLIENHRQWLEGNDGISQGLIVYRNRDSNLWARYTCSRGRYRFPHGTSLRFTHFNTGNVALRTAHFINVGRAAAGGRTV